MSRAENKDEVIIPAMKNGRTAIIKAYRRDEAGKTELKIIDIRTY